MTSPHRRWPTARPPHGSNGSTLRPIGARPRCRGIARTPIHRSSSGWGVGGRAGTAVVVGCGYGRDAEHLSRLGYETTAFDISPTAIGGARARHPASTVHTRLLTCSPCRTLARRVRLVVEIRNVQALPPALHAQAAAAVSSLVAPGGTVFVAGAVGDGHADGPPWPLTRSELEGFAVDGVEPATIDAVGLRQRRRVVARGVRSR